MVQNLKVASRWLTSVIVGDSATRVRPRGSRRAASLLLLMVSVIRLAVASGSADAMKESTCRTDEED